MRTAFITSILLVLPATALAQRTPISKSNWRTHPDVVAVRAIYDSTERLIARGGAIAVKKEFGFCENGAESERRMWSDSAGRVLKYVSAGGSEDSFSTDNFYYDRAGRLRFVFETSGHVNGRHEETRVYLDSTGRRVWEDHRLTRGPGEASDESIGEERLERAPRKAFAAPDPCAEADSTK